MKFCTKVPRTCVHQRLVLDFHFFCLNRVLETLISDSTQICNFLKKMAHNKHGQAYKEHKPSTPPKDASAKFYLPTAFGLSLMISSSAG